LSLTRDAGAPPTWPVSGSGDNATAVGLYSAIVTALYRRERTGIGSYVTTSLLAEGVWSASVSIQAALAGAKFPPMHDRMHPANAAMNVYRSSDGTWFVLIVTPDKCFEPATLAALHEDGRGTLSHQRLHQLIRQPGSIRERTLEITFPEAGAEAYCFTFG